MAIEIRVLTSDDFELLMNPAEEVFDYPIQPDFAREFLDDPRHHIVVAIADGRIVGFVSAVHYLHPDSAPQLFINEVSMAPDYRRRGLSKSMMVAMFEIGRANQCEEAWVLTDRLNAAAMALYESVGGREGADSESPNDATIGYTFHLLQ
jgi:ribosomal protein S18 acetylase RimI-like enzyme